MTAQDLFEQIKAKGSYLCVGLDTDIHKIPSYLKSAKDPIFEFNRAIIESTERYCVSYKPNLAFYEALGPKGLESLHKTLEIIPKDQFTIADAKRGDIGNTAAMYASSFFDYYGFDAVTVSPYMGADSLEPFLAHKGKWTIVLALTSNEGSNDLQKLNLSTGNSVFSQVIKMASKAGSADQVMFVAGATHGETLELLRKQAPNYFFLVPGVGAQGGDLQSVSKAAFNNQCGLLVNASRSIIYASSGRDFAKAAQKEASAIAVQMKNLMMRYMP